MDAVSKIVGYLLKLKFVQGHRRQISTALTVLTAGAAALSYLGPILPPWAVPVLATASSYIGIVGHLFAGEKPAGS